MNSRASRDDTGSGLSYREARPADLDGVLQFLVRCDILESGEPATSREDVQYEWSLLRPEQDVRLAFDRMPTLVGYAAVFPWAGMRRYEMHVDPAWRESELPRGLWEWCEEHARSLPALEPAVPGGASVTYLSHVDWQGAQIAEAAGFQAVRLHLNFRAQLDQGMPSAHWPKGINVREFKPGQDDRAVHSLIEESFDRPGRQPVAFEAWKSFMLRADILDPGLWFLAMAESRPVGACLCFQYPEEGWVRQLAVSPEWQGRGIGQALLRHAFLAFWRRGYTHVGLSVASDNSRARGFYERQGMHCLRQYVEYVRRRDDPAPATNNRAAAQS